MTDDQPDLGFSYRFEPADASGDAALITLVLLHGAGGDETSLLEVGRRVGSGAALLSPRGKFDQVGGEGGARFIPRLPDGTADADAAHRCAGELADLVSGACDAFGLDPAAVFVLGFSNGATAATAVALDHPDLLAGGIVLSGRPPFREPGGRILDGKKFFCAHCRGDEIVTIDDYEELVESLVSSGAEVELHWYDTGHEISDHEVQDVREWLRKQAAELAAAREAAAAAALEEAEAEAPEGEAGGGAAGGGAAGGPA